MCYNVYIASRPMGRSGVSTQPGHWVLLPTGYGRPPRIWVVLPTTACYRAAVLCWAADCGLRAATLLLQRNRKKRGKSCGSCVSVLAVQQSQAPEQMPLIAVGLVLYPLSACLKKHLPQTKVKALHSLSARQVSMHDVTAVAALFHTSFPA